MSIKILDEAPRLLRDVPIVERYFWIRGERYEELCVRSIWGELLFVNTKHRHGIPVGAVLVGDPNRVHKQMGMFYMSFDEGIFSALRGMTYIPGYYTQMTEHVQMHRGTLAWAFSVAWNFEMLNEAGRDEWRQTLALIGLDLRRFHHPHLVEAGVYASAAVQLADESLDVRTNLVYASDQSLVEWTRVGAQTFMHFDMRRMALVAQLDRIWQTLALIRDVCTGVLETWNPEMTDFDVEPHEVYEQLKFGEELAASVFSAPWPSGSWIRDRFAQMQQGTYEPVAVRVTLKAILNHCDRLDAWRTLQEVLISVALMERFGQMVEDTDVLGFIYALQGAHRALASSDTGIAEVVEVDLSVATASLMQRDFDATKVHLKQALVRIS